MVVATRRVAFGRAGRPQGALTLAVLLLGAAAASHAARLVLTSAGPREGQTLWALGTALVALAGWRAAGTPGEDAAASEPVPGEDSRLRLLPATLAALVVAAIAVQQAA